MGNQKVREKKKPTFFLAVLPILAMILLLGVGYAVMGLSPEVLMLVSAAVAAGAAFAACASAVLAGTRSAKRSMYFVLCLSRLVSTL